MPVAEMKSKILQFAEEFPITDLDEIEVFVSATQTSNHPVYPMVLR
jgi:hypothetical protein